MHTSTCIHTSFFVGTPRSPPFASPVDVVFFWEKKQRATAQRHRFFGAPRFGHEGGSLSPFQPYVDRFRMLGLSEKPAGAPSGGGLTAGANVKITGGNYKVPWEETHGGKLWKRVIFFCCKIQNMYTDKLRR